jgi:hypothetical protein
LGLGAALWDNKILAFRRYSLPTASRVFRSFYSVTAVITQKNGISRMRLHDKAQVLNVLQRFSHCLFLELYVVVFLALQPIVFVFSQPGSGL